MSMPAFRRRLLNLAIDWLPFLGAWLWVMRFNPLTQGPAYGDVLEVVWGMDWYADKLRTLAAPWFYPLIFHPIGWYTASLAHTPLFLAALGLLRLVLPAALVFNSVLLLSFVVCYAGMRWMLRLYVGNRWITLLIALIYTFSGMRWVHIFGHLNVAWLTAMIPWQVWALEADMPARRRIWLSGLFWGLAISASLYAIWLGVLLYACYWLAMPSWKALRAVVLIGLIALVLSAPSSLLFWQASRSEDLLIFGLKHISYWGASLNSLFAPAVLNPLLSSVASAIYSGPFDESGVMNFGPLFWVLVIWGLVHVSWRSPRHRFVLLLSLLGCVLALGPILRWNGQPVHAPILDSLDGYLWGLGQVAKPQLFGSIRPDVFINSVPLPAWLIYAIFPFAEGARVAARFGFVAAVGLAVPAAIGLASLRVRWLLVLATVLLVLEAAPWPISQGVKLPPDTHPAFQWLRSQPAKGPDAVLDLKNGQDGLTLPISGDVLYATQLHGKPAVAGVGSYWPHTTWIWINWLNKHQRPFHDPEFATLLEAFGVRWILLHVDDPQLQTVIQEIDLPEVKLARCFDPAAGASPWPYPICVLEVTPSAAPFDAVPDSGWSGSEDWGRWAEGTQSDAHWVAPVRGAYALKIGAFPQCAPGRSQQIKVTANDEPAGTIEFQGCEPVTTVLELPADTVNLGWNRLHFEYAYAVSPQELTGSGSDNRPLSVGFTELTISPTEH